MSKKLILATALLVLAATLPRPVYAACFQLSLALCDANCHLLK